MLELVQVYHSLLLEVLDSKCSPCIKSFVDGTLVDNAVSSFPQLISKRNIAAVQPREPRLEATFTVSRAAVTPLGIENGTALLHASDFFPSIGSRDLRQTRTHAAVRNAVIEVTSL
jgi:hypothetical protein